MNWQAIRAIYVFEMARTFRTILQSLVAPVISTSLYFVVFGTAIGSRIEEERGHQLDELRLAETIEGQEQQQHRNARLVEERAERAEELLHEVRDLTRLARPVHGRARQDEAVPEPEAEEQDSQPAQRHRPSQAYVAGPVLDLAREHDEESLPGDRRQAVKHAAHTDEE